MAASCGDELAEDWWETKGSGRESRTSRKRSKDSASTCPFGTEAGDSPVPKKKRKKRSVKSAVEGDEAALLSPTQQCEVLQLALRQYFDGRLTPIEEDQIELQDNWFALASGCCRQTSVSELLLSVFPNWEKSKSKITQKGSPLVLLVGSAALRILDLSRQAAPAVGKSKLAKLFAKHFKVHEQESFLRSTVTPVAMGTPNRLQKLIDCGALGLTKLHVVILDWHWKDQKERTITGIPEVWGDLAELLRHSLLPLLRKGRTKILLY